MSMLLGTSSVTLLLHSGGTTFPSPQQERLTMSSPPTSSSSSPSRTIFSYRGCRAAVQTTQTQAHGRGRGYGVVETGKKRPQSLYNVLRVNPDASFVEIKTAYRTLAKLYHPDVSSSSDQSARSHSPSKDGGQDFMRIRTAYVTLSDPSSRSLYDMSLGLGVVGVGRRSCRRPSPPFSAASHDHRPPPPSAFHRTTSRWETDQCW